MIMLVSNANLSEMLLGELLFACAYLSKSVNKNPYSRSPLASTNGNLLKVEQLPQMLATTSWALAQ